MLDLPLSRVRDGYGRQTVERRGIPFRTDVYVVDEHLVWGATARMLGDLLERVPEALLDRDAVAGSARSQVDPAPRDG